MSLKVMYYKSITDTDIKKVVCNITSDSIHLELYDVLGGEKTESKLTETDILLADIRDSQNIDDGSLYVVDVDRAMTKIMQPFNYTAYSLADRSHFRVRDSGDRTGILYVFVPFAEASFSECEIFLALASGTTITSNVGYDESPFIPMVSYEKMDELLYPIELSVTPAATVPAGGQVNITITVYDRDNQVFDYPMEIYLTSRVGYLPYRKVKVTGTAEVPVHALGLKAGDIIRVKAGYRWYANLTHLDIEVV